MSSTKSREIDQIIPKNLEFWRLSEKSGSAMTDVTRQEEIRSGSCRPQMASLTQGDGHG
jgi:hypothetical protein